MKVLTKIVPWLFVALFAIEIFFVMKPKKDGEFHTREFGRLPVLLNGRIQPFDSVARNSLLQIRSTGDYPLEIVPSWKFWHHAKKLKATDWLLQVMARPEEADTNRIFLIHNPDLIGALKLQDKGIELHLLRYYSFDEIRPVVPEIFKEVEPILKREEEKRATPEQRTVFEKQLMKLYNAMTLYQRVKCTLQPEGEDNWSQQLADFQKNIAAARAQQGGQNGENLNQELLQRINKPYQEIEQMARFGYALMIPPADPEGSRDNWQNAGTSILESARANQFPVPVTDFAAMSTAYRANNAADFNTAVDHYNDWLKSGFTKELKKGRAEFYYNDVKAFLHCIIMYIFALGLACVALLTLTLAPSFSETLRRSAFYIIILAWCFHTSGLLFRMILEGRPPVTNLYSSAIFIGWGAAFLGIILERIYRLGIGNIVAAFAGFVTLLIAHNLALGGDTMEMMRAVLDNNFWLATHVVVVTTGYASTFVAGLLAIVYIVLGIFTPQLTHILTRRDAQGLIVGGYVAGGVVGAAAGAAIATAVARRPGELTIGKALSKMVYGIICFATLFSFTGTVLGGIWADQSWGRFWGWDPKENGALLIVLWNAIILHARWGGIVRDRGIMNLAIVGNIATSFSWFGVNLLSIGLHSYGFTDTGAEYLFNFVLSQVVLLANGMLPLAAWASFRATSGFLSTWRLRAIVGILDGLWFLMAILWFVGVYWAQPSLANFGKIGAITAVIAILLVLLQTWVMVRFIRFSKNLPPAAPGTVDLGTPAPAK
jgi:cytochrome c-type biogenesis protein CcsB